MADSRSEAPVAAVENPRDLRSTAGFILTGLSGGHGVFHWFTQSFFVMLPEVKATFGLTDVQVGSIMTIRQVASGVITLPGGILSDIMRRQWGLVLALCMGGFGLGWLVMGLSPAFAGMLVGLAIVAIASSMWHLPAMASLSHHFSHRRGTALSLHGVGGNVGDVIGPIVTGSLLAILSWQNILSIYAVVPLLLVVVVFWAFRDIGKTKGGTTARPDVAMQFQLTKNLLRNPILWGINLVVALRGMSHIAFMTFLPLYLKDELELSSSSVGLHFGLLTLVGIATTPAMGYLSDRVGRKVVLVPGLLGLSLLTLMLVSYGEGLMLTAIIVMLGLFLFSDQPILTAAALDIVGENVATTTLGVLSFSRFALSAASPLLAGMLSETWGIDATFQYIAGLFAVAAVILLMLPLKRAVKTRQAQQR